MKKAACCAVLLSVWLGHAWAQAPSPVVKTTTAGVIIDVSVLDNTGQPVLDLTRDEFEITEDGKRQHIVSVSLVRAGVARSRSGQSVPAPAAALAPEPPAPPNVTSTTDATGADAGSTPSVTAILFDRLSPEVRAIAGRAALAYVATLSPPHDYAGVFLADTTLMTLQPFTNQADSLREGVALFVATATTNLTKEAERSITSRMQDLDPSQPVTPGAESGAGWINALEREKKLREPSPDGMLRAMEYRMFEGYQRFLTEYEGQSSLAGLTAVVAGLKPLPGRKSILYFTESLPLTSRLKPRFDALIGEANRANITMYPVDAAGLRVHSKEAEVNRNVSVAGAQGVGDARRDDGPWTRDLEKQDQLLSSRPTAVLGRLARETGGFLLESTNDLTAGVARMQQERTTYYLLAYQPANAAMDGKFRRVSVKVKRPKVTVKARPGYLAVAPGTQ